MKRFFVVLLAGLICGALGTGVAVAAEGTMKIATMDLKKVLEISKTGQVVQAAVKQKFAEYQVKLQKKEDALRALKDEIVAKEKVWSEEVLNQKDREFKRGAQNLEEESKDASNDMKLFERKQVEPILKELEGIINDYGKAQGLAVILDTTRGIVYQDEALDISAKIAAELDKRHPADEVKADSETVKPGGKAAKGDAKR